MEIWGVTDSGKVRQHNQDVFKTLYDEDKGIAVLVVCDGVGGANAGNVASALASETFMHHMGKHIENISTLDDIGDDMTSAIYAANKAVYDKSSHEDDYAGMGTTLTAAVSTNEGEVVANIGDSRVYHVALSKITQVTRDHTVIEDMITRGDITRAEARRHPSKHLITRALGMSRKEEPDIFYLNLKSGEHLLLCSDGLSDVILESEILFELQRGFSVRESCDKLLEMALERGAPDNVTAVIFRK